jgi:uncharacterized protein RhaS with RHS repeats
LIGASGGFGGDERQLEYGNDAFSNYDLEMTYTKSHSIETKTQNHEKNGVMYEPNTYKNAYKLQDGTHRVEHVTDDSAGRHTTFKYDLNGNITHRGVNDGGDVDYYWDEVNRLRVVADRFGLQHYIYDGAGERVLKATTDREAIYENGALISNSVNIMGYTTYPSAHLVVDKNGIFSKHYYVGTQRIVSRLGDESARIFEDEREEGPAREGEESTLDEKKIKTAQKADLQFYADQTQHKTYTFAKYSGSTVKEEEQKMKEFDGKENTQEVLVTEATDERPIYFYHPDHLGTTNALTDANGTMYQFFLNLPFGESMAEQSPTLAPSCTRCPRTSKRTL